MTDLHELPPLSEYSSTIEAHARICYRKLKKPTIYDTDDLIQEGVNLFLKARRSFDSTKGKQFSFFLNRCLRNGFGGIVKKSYKSINQIPLYNKEGQITIIHTAKIKCISTNNPNYLFDLNEQLTKVEKEYLVALLNPTTFVEEILHLNLKKLRTIIRNKLQLTNQEGIIIEHKIKSLLRT